VAVKWRSKVAISLRRDEHKAFAGLMDVRNAATKSLTMLQAHLAERDGYFAGAILVTANPPSHNKSSVLL